MHLVTCQLCIRHSDNLSKFCAACMEGVCGALWLPSTPSQPPPSMGRSRAVFGVSEWQKRWGKKKRLQPKLEPYDWAEAKSKVGQRQGRRICHLPLSIGSGRRIDPQLGVAIRGPREEEFGARLSDVLCMNSTGLVGNPDTDMSAMHFCMGAEGSANARTLGRCGRGVFWGGAGCRQKEKGFARGESEALRGSGRSP